jgi:hypothetical protein
MSSLSRTYARRSKREGNLMKQYQPPGAYQSGEAQHNEALARKREERQKRKEAGR